MTSQLPRTSGIAVAALLLLVSGGGQGAWAQQAPEPPQLSDLVQAGDLVTITPWNGHRFSGEVVYVTTCDFDVRVAKGFVTVPLSSLKTLRQHRRREPNKAAAFMLDTANNCHDIDCLPGSLFYAGLAAAVQGVDDLGHPPKVVYRAKRPLPAGACGTPVASRHASR